MSRRIAGGLRARLFLAHLLVIAVGMATLFVATLSIAPTLFERLMGGMMGPDVSSMGGMMGGMMGQSGSMTWTGVVAVSWLLVVAGIVLLLIWGIRRIGNRSMGAADEAPLMILQRRYARGEIGPDEYERIRADLLPQLTGTASYTRTLKSQFNTGSGKVDTTATQFCNRFAGDPSLPLDQRVDVPVDNVVPGASCPAHHECAYEEQREMPEIGDRRAGLHRGERRRPPARNQEKPGADRAIEAREPQIGAQRNGRQAINEIPGRIGDAARCLAHCPSGVPVNVLKVPVAAFRLVLAVGICVVPRASLSVGIAGLPGAPPIPASQTCFADFAMLS